MRRLRILLVEDDALICALLAELLGELGHEVCGTAATDGEAVAAALLHTPDLMIVDMQLRVGTGVSAMDTILRRGAMPHVFMTGGPRLAVAADAIVLLKPFDMAFLKAALDGVSWQIAKPTGGDTHLER